MNMDGRVYAAILLVLLLLLLLPRRNTRKPLRYAPLRGQKRPFREKIQVPFEYALLAQRFPWLQFEEAGTYALFLVDAQWPTLDVSPALGLIEAPVCDPTGNCTARLSYTLPVLEERFELEGPVPLTGRFGVLFEGGLYVLALVRDGAPVSILPEVGVATTIPKCDNTRGVCTTAVTYALPPAVACCSSFPGGAPETPLAGPLSCTVTASREACIQRGGTPAVGSTCSPDACGAASDPFPRTQVTLSTEGPGPLFLVDQDTRTVYDGPFTDETVDLFLPSDFPVRIASVEGRPSVSFELSDVNGITCFTGTEIDLPLQCRGCMCVPDP